MFPTTPTQGVAQPSAPLSVAPQTQPLSSAATAPKPRHAPKWLVIFLFCLFAGLIPETIITSSTSPLKLLLNPIGIFFISLFYGLPGLVIREIMVRRRARLARVLLLGAAFGFVNEGVAAGTWYTVHNPGLIFINGVDWPWAIALTLFHTVISVITPIAFIEILFPSTAGKPLLRGVGIAICVIPFLGFALLLALTPLYRSDRLSALAAAILLSLLALALPPWRAPVAAPPPLMPPTYSQVYPAEQLEPQPAIQSDIQPATRPLPGLWRLRLTGFLAMFAYFVLIYLFPVIIAAILKSLSNGIIIAQGIDGAVFLVFGALVIWRGWSWSRRAGWSPRQNLALLIGAATFTTLVMLLPAQVALDEPYATIPFYILLIVLTLCWWFRSRSAASRQTGARPADHVA